MSRLFFEYFVCFALALFLLMTVLKELKLFPGLWGFFPTFTHFVPSWSFFAPNPYQEDYFILYRGVDKSGEIGPWKQVYEIKKRLYYSFIWNPNKIALKVFVDLCIDLVSVSSATKNTSKVCLSLPYLHILSYVDSLAKSQHRNSYQQVQFTIVTQVNNGTPSLAFLSEVHSTSFKGQ